MADKHRYALIAGACMVGLLIFIYAGSRDDRAKTHAPAPSKWITASYGNLIDHGQITQSGQKLGEVLAKVDRETHLRGSVQPFLAPFSSLLPHVLDMAGSPPGRPYVEVHWQYPPGSEQPAWAAILRSGSMRIYFDGQEKAKVFLQGDDPKQCYERDYGIIRHVLQGLLPNTPASTLSIEVFAYKNDFARQELSLNLNPYRASSSSFPPGRWKIPLDLAGLQTFFQQKGILEGGQIDPAKGLVLYARKPDVIDSHEFPVSIVDLAVVYRAVFHAGDNKAFVSLDPHGDATKVTVNFGGLLEDTRVGAVVLEADKRFKTITCGLDPNSMNDVRSLVRAQIPSFLTSAERELMLPLANEGKWEGTRFWYYPDSVKVDADLDYSTAAIRKAQFTAAAERDGPDSKNGQESDQLKRQKLSPAIRENIDHLNNHYPDYATVFPELRQLNAVARLFGICVWLKRAKVANLDLDSLLSVVLPSCTTERERVQLVASSRVARIKGQGLDAASVALRSRVTCHTGALGQRVENVFGGWQGVAEYLCLLNGTDTDGYKRYAQEAQRLYADSRSYSITALVRSQKELEALALFLAHQVEPMAPEAHNLERTIDAQGSQLDALKGEIASLKSILDRRADNSKAQAVAAYNLQVRRHNTLVEQYESLRVTMNTNIDKLNAMGPYVGSVTEIGGGISLAPDLFSVNADGTSPVVGRLRSIGESIKTEWTAFNDSTQWIKSRSDGQGSVLPPIRMDLCWKGENQGTAGRSYSSAFGRYWFAPPGAGQQWRDQFTASDGFSVCRLGDLSAKTLQVVTFKGAAIDSHIVGIRESADRIVFKRSTRTDVLPAQAPPTWYRP